MSFSSSRLASSGRTATGADVAQRAEMLTTWLMQFRSAPAVGFARQVLSAFTAISSAVAVTHRSRDSWDVVTVPKAARTISVARSRVTDRLRGVLHARRRV